MFTHCSGHPVQKTVLFKMLNSKIAYLRFYSVKRPRKPHPFKELYQWGPWEFPEKDSVVCSPVFPRSNNLRLADTSCNHDEEFPLQPRRKTQSCSPQAKLRRWYTCFLCKGTLKTNGVSFLCKLLDRVQSTSIKLKWLRSLLYGGKMVRFQGHFTAQIEFMPNKLLSWVMICSLWPLYYNFWNLFPC